MSEKIKDFTMDFIEVTYSLFGAKDYYPIGQGGTPSNPYKSDFDDSVKGKCMALRTVREWHNDYENPIELIYQVEGSSDWKYWKGLLKDFQKLLE